jgi:hypothetical protein
VAAETDNPALEHYALFVPIFGTIKGDVKQVKQRLVSLEVAAAGLCVENAHMYGDMAEQHARYDLSPSGLNVSNGVWSLATRRSNAGKRTNITLCSGANSSSVANMDGHNGRPCI